MSSPMDPVGTVLMSATGCCLSSRMIEPLPNCFSIAPTARSMALSRSAALVLSAELPGSFVVVFAIARLLVVRVFYRCGMTARGSRIGFKRPGSDLRGLGTFLFHLTFEQHHPVDPRISVRLFRHGSEKPADVSRRLEPGQRHMAVPRSLLALEAEHAGRALDLLHHLAEPRAPRRIQPGPDHARLLDRREPAEASALDLDRAHAGERRPHPIAQRLDHLRPAPPQELQRHMIGGRRDPARPHRLHALHRLHRIVERAHGRQRHPRTDEEPHRGHCFPRPSPSARLGRAWYPQARFARDPHFLADGPGPLTFAPPPPSPSTSPTRRPASEPDRARPATRTPSSRCAPPARPPRSRRCRPACPAYRRPAPRCRSPPPRPTPRSAASARSPSRARTPRSPPPPHPASPARPRAAAPSPRSNRSPRLRRTSATIPARSSRSRRAFRQYRTRRSPS